MPAPQFVTVLCLLLDGGPPSVDESSPPSCCLQFYITARSRLYRPCSYSHHSEPQGPSACCVLLSTRNDCA